MVKNWCALVICLLACGSLADTTRCLAPEDFLIDPALINLQGFEASPTDEVSAQYAALGLPGITISTPSANLSVHDTVQFGQAPVSGSKYLRISGGTEIGGSLLKFQFNSAINRFGMYIIDWGDGTQSGNPTLRGETDTGDQLEIATGLKTDANVFFFGFTTQNPFQEFTVFNDISTDSWAIDDVYFGTPEPSTVAILSLGLLVLIGPGKQHKKAR